MLDRVNIEFIDGQEEGPTYSLVSSDKYLLANFRIRVRAITSRSEGQNKRKKKTHQNLAYRDELLLPVL